jgi:hypothetical protein
MDTPQPSSRRVTSLAQPANRAEVKAQILGWLYQSHWKRDVIVIGHDVHTAGNVGVLYISVSRLTFFLLVNSYCPSCV